MKTDPKETLNCALCALAVQACQAETSDGRHLCQDCADTLCRTCGERSGSHETYDGVFMCDECHETRNDRFYDADRDKDWA